MLVKLFRANYLYHFILVPLLALLLLLKSLIDGGSFPAESCVQTTPLCNLLYNSGINYFWAILLNYFLVVITIILLVHTNDKYALVRQSSFLQPLIFVLIVYSFPDLHTIQPVFFSAIFLILAMRSLFESYNRRKALTSSFDAAFLIGLASVFYFYALPLVVLVPISLVTIRNNLTWKELTISLIGVILPWLFVFSYYFIGENLDGFYNLLKNAQISRTTDLLQNPYVKAYLIFLLLIIIAASALIINQYGQLKISIRRYYKVLAFFFGIVILLFFIPSVSIEIMVFLAIPLSFLFANFLLSLRRKFVAELLAYLLVIFALVLQFFS